MRVLLLPVIPGLILLFSVIASYVSRKSLGKVLSTLNRKASEIEDISAKHLSKEIFTFLASRSAMEASRARALVSMGVNLGREEIESAAGEVKSGIVDLVPSLRRAAEASLYLDRVRNGIKWVVRTLLIYGITISASGYLLIGLYYVGGSSRTLSLLAGIFFGGTVIFAIVIAMVLLDVDSASKAIHLRFEETESEFI
ncbi:hypothetical protein [Thermogymnomonas acidicola]|uniref:hypothetical protein n=1 Tax=Thermogymnomonas acidicola TaxID=399579 RepID=UPI001664610E|nr:hypothetical protein [Thermogymnomonas acidicola]